MDAIVRLKDRYDAAVSEERRRRFGKGTGNRKAKSNDVYLALKERDRVGGGKYGFWHWG